MSGETHEIGRRRSHRGRHGVRVGIGRLCVLLLLRLML